MGPASNGSATETETWMLKLGNDPARCVTSTRIEEIPHEIPYELRFSWENHRSQWWMFHCYDLISGGYVDGTHRRSCLLEYQIVKRHNKLC